MGEPMSELCAGESELRLPTGEKQWSRPTGMYLISRVWIWLLGQPHLPIRSTFCIASFPALVTGFKFRQVFVAPFFSIGFFFSFFFNCHFLFFLFSLLFLFFPFTFRFSLTIFFLYFLFLLCFLCFFFHVANFVKTNVRFLK